MEEVKKSKVIQHSNLTKVVHHVVRDKIVTQELKPGSKIIEEELAKEMGVSRTPLKIALGKLEKEGLVETISRKGTYVKRFSVKDIKDIYELRRVLEEFAVESAIGLISREQLEKMKKVSEDYRYFMKEGNMGSCLKSDTQFHELLIEASKNSKLSEVIKSFSLQVKSFEMGSLDINKRGEKTVKEHLAILDALTKGDSKLAKKLIREHITDAEEHILASLKAHNRINGDS